VSVADPPGAPGRTTADSGAPPRPAGSGAPAEAAPAAGMPSLSVVVPTLGREPGLSRLLDRLDAQTYPGDRFEVVLAVDGQATAAWIADLEQRGVRVVAAAERGGPGAARNRGAAAAAGDWIAFTEDDCLPDPEWLEHAAREIARDTTLEVVVGETRKPGGRPVHRQSGPGPLWLPTSLFVKRATFARVGGFAEDYWDAERRLYFREDSDFGFRLEAAGARWARAREAVVEHPDEHALAHDALRWAARHEFDPLLAARHPERFRERVEVHRLGPFVVRRPIVRAAVAHALTLPLAAAAALAGQGRLAAGFGAVALLGWLAVWAKWRFRPSHAWASLAVPWVLAASLARGRALAARAMERGAGGAGAT
jgi:GT2 family glycosyltransferase